MHATLRQGGTTYGTMAFEFFTPGLMPVLAACGAEWVILDMEHSGAGIETMKAMIAAARGLSIVPMVRVPGTAYHLIAPVLDAGAAGIMVPMVESAEQAADIAAWCRYPPEGRRGLAFNIAHDDYRGGDPVAKMAAANERTLVIALVETARGIANVDAIMAVPGIDIGWLGHFDLTATMGITGGHQALGRLRPERQAGRDPGELGRDGAAVPGARVPLHRLRHGYRAAAIGVRRGRGAAEGAGDAGQGRMKRSWATPSDQTRPCRASMRASSRPAATEIGKQTAK